jgi:hypothetical protein
VEKSKIENNLYYCGAIEETSTPKFLETHRAHGASGSDVYADPLFVDLKPGDFRLKPESPALKMGIKQINLSGVGLTREFPKRLLE